MIYSSYICFRAFCTFVLVIVFCSIPMLRISPSTPFIQCRTSFRSHICSTFLDWKTCLLSGRLCHPMCTPLNLRGQKKILDMDPSLVFSTQVCTIYFYFHLISSKLRRSCTCLSGAGVSGRPFRSHRNLPSTALGGQKNRQ